MVDGETAQKIALDVGNGVDPADSDVEYGPEELAFRKQVEDELAAARKDNPKLFLHVIE